MPCKLRIPPIALNLTRIGLKVGTYIDFEKYQKL